MLVGDCVKGYEKIIIRCGHVVATCDQEGFKQMDQEHYFSSKKVRGFYSFNKKVRLVI